MSGWSIANAFPYPKVAHARQGEAGIWTPVVSFLLLGYFCLGRSFAYWGIPPWKIFIGEIVLILFFFFGPRTPQGSWLWAAMGSRPLRRFRKALLLFLAFGTFQVLRGIASGHPFLTAARDLALNYYPFYFFLGLLVGLRSPGFLATFFRQAAWLNGLYGILFVLFLNRIPLFMPGVSGDVTPVALFGQPMFSAAILLGLLCFEKQLRPIWPLFFLNVLVMLGMLIRGEWVAFAFGLLAWGWITQRIRKVVLVATLGVALLALMYVTGFAIEGPETRGGTISAQAVVARIVAPINPDLAASLTGDSQMYEDTAVWRTLWWAAIWSSAYEGASQALLGHGYGFALNDLVPYLEDSATRTPHNVFFLTLGYSGWLGVLIFAFLQAEIAGLLWRVHRTRGQPFGIVFWTTMLAFSLFTAFFEAPYGAIPFYLLTGCASAALFRVQGRGAATGNRPRKTVAFAGAAPEAARG